VNPRDGDAETGPVQARGTVLTVRRVDAYYAMTVVAPGIAARFRPGQFLAVAVGGPQSSMLLRRAFSIHDVRPDHGGTVEFIFAASGPGTRWLAERRSRDVLDVTGPHGRPFPVPREPAACLLVGGGYGSAPLFALAGKLKDRHCPVDFLLGAASGDRVFGALTARRMGRTATITTEDGSLGSRGMVTDLLGQVIQQARTDVIYACGPMPMLRAVGQVATQGQADALKDYFESVRDLEVDVTILSITPDGDGARVKFVRRDRCLGRAISGSRHGEHRAGLRPQLLGGPAQRKQED
jgi:dihydroorotate dehydrogenase electron transfer subunit